jgi:hypothetical protein
VPLVYSTGGYNVDMYELGLFFSAMICTIGVFLLLLGGLIFRGRFLWIITLLVGIAYLAALPRVWIPHEIIMGRVGWVNWFGCLFSAFPGLVCIMGGVLIQWLAIRSNKKATETHPSI